jgi:hypothetical protein
LEGTNVEVYHYLHAKMQVDDFQKDHLVQRLTGSRRIAFLRNVIG